MPAVDHDPAIVVLLREHFAVGRQIGQHTAVVHAHLHVHVEKAPAQGLAHRGGQIGAFQSPSGR